MLLNLLSVCGSLQVDPPTFMWHVDVTLLFFWCCCFLLQTVLLLEGVCFLKKKLCDLAANLDKRKPTAPAVPRRSPIQVLSRPDTA